MPYRSLLNDVVHMVIATLSSSKLFCEWERSLNVRHSEAASAVPFQQTNIFEREEKANWLIKITYSAMQLLCNVSLTSQIDQTKTPNFIRKKTASKIMQNNRIE